MTKRQLIAYVLVGIPGLAAGVVLYLTLRESGSAKIVSRSESAESFENLRAFAKLFGYVRYFHPSDAASALDWDRMAIYGVREVLETDGRDDLRGVLENLFPPVAPTARIFFEGETADPGLLACPAVLLTDWIFYLVPCPNPGLFCCS